MPLDFETFPPRAALREIRRKLEQIDPADGYNTRPRVGEQFVPADQVGELPFLCLDPAILLGDEQLFGDDEAETFTEDADLGFVVWGYFEDESNPEEAMWALLCDALSAMWSDETLGDLVAGVDLVKAEWDLPTSQDQNRGTFVIQMRARLLFDRGG